MHDAVYEDMLAKIDEDTDLPMVTSMIQYLSKHDMITDRERALLMQVVTNAFESGMEPAVRVSLLKSLILTLQNFS